MEGIWQNIFYKLKPYTLHLINALFPAKCCNCESYLPLEFQQNDPAPYNNSFEKIMALHLCAGCAKDFLPIYPPVCEICGSPLNLKENNKKFCGECAKSQNYFSKARAAGLYGASFKTVIHQFKYDKKIQLARPLGVLLQDAFMRFWEKNEIDTALPVPLHIKRFRDRGFNQAYLLIRNWNKINGLPPVEKKILIRSRWTNPQASLKREERLKNLKNAFAVQNVEKIKGKNILLVDDVFTTGSTANECAKVLLESGARRVDVLTLAKT